MNKYTLVLTKTGWYLMGKWTTPLNLQEAMLLFLEPQIPFEYVQ